MDTETRIMLRERPELIRFIRVHPQWYRYLAREPASFSDLEREAKVYYGKTLPQRVERIGNQLQMLRLLAGMAKEFGE